MLYVNKYKEINGRRMTDPEIEAYLERLSLSPPSSPDLTYLKQLHWAHLQSIPFENLDIMQGIPVSLKREDLFQKLIRNKRGGVCAELNTLFNWLLESLGYSVISYSSRVISQKTSYPHRSHRLMGVYIDGKTWLADVGYYYEHHRVPLLLQEGTAQFDGIHRYYLQKAPVHGWLLWHEWEGHNWHVELSFTEEPQLDVDFITLLYYSQYHPASPTNKCLKGSIHSGDSLHFIQDDLYRVTHKGKLVSVEEAITQERRRELFQTLFHISIPETL